MVGYLHILQSEISQERSKIMNFYKRSYQPILHYLYTKAIKHQGEILLHKHFKDCMMLTPLETLKQQVSWGENLVASYTSGILRFRILPTTTSQHQLHNYCLISSFFKHFAMASFESVHNLPCLGFDHGLLDEEEFLVMYEAYSSENPTYPYKDYSRFNFKLKDDVKCKTEFRVEKKDIPELVHALRIPESVECYQGAICEAEEALCILLKRFTCPCRYSDLIPCFGRQ